MDDEDKKLLATEMVRLERKYPLSDDEHETLKNLHSIHGSGLLDSIKEWVWENLHPVGRLAKHIREKRK